jgi:hypothetical protein
MQTVAYALTVTPLPTLTLNTASTSVAVVRGSSVKVGFTAVTGGPFNGNISYSLSGLPAGVTAQWSANPQTPSASVSTSSQTLTLTASSAGAAASGTVVVSAAGDGLTAGKSLTLQVQTKPGVLLTVSPQEIWMPSRSRATATVTETPQGGVVAEAGASGSSLSITSGLPKGITALWSAPIMTSAGAVVRTLTLTGSPSAISSASSLDLSATLASRTGSIYKTSGNLPVTVTLTRQASRKEGR